MEKLGMEEGIPIEHKMVTRAIERAQTQVEAQHFSIRKHLLEYDDVMNKQRESVYGLRRELLEGRIQLDFEEGSQELDSRAYLMTLAEGHVEAIVESHCGEEIEPEDWDIDALRQSFGDLFGLNADQRSQINIDDTGVDTIEDSLWNAARNSYEQKETTIDGDTLRRVERDVMLQVVDVQWKDHLYGLDHLKEGISLRGYGQRQPLVEYKRESFSMFQAMKERVDEDTIKYLWRLRPVPKKGEASPTQPRLRSSTPISYNEPKKAVSALNGPAGSLEASGPRPTRTGGDDATVRTVRRDVSKIGRNEPCPCGSGKKYKKCHGA
tara:strand:- start:12355 stop:13323 length:969 start_codon:yes stop_codon:yes gene_type:complete